MTENSLRLFAEPSRSPLDARRGVVRLHPTVLHALGLHPWDAVVVRGQRPTGGLAALAPPDAEAGTILLDALTCANAGASFGEEVTVGPAAVRPAELIAIAGGPPQAAPDPALLRLALLGKVLFRGDAVSLLPQDFTGRAERAMPVHDVLAGLASTFGDAWQSVELEVVDTQPSGLVSVTMETVVSFAGSATTSSATPWSRDVPPTARDLPGLEEQARSLRELLELGFSGRDLLKRLGGSPRLGVFMSGPPGSGKSALVEAVCAELHLRLIRMWGPALARVEPNAGARELKSLIEQATEGPPTVVLIEDVDALVPAEDAGPLASLALEQINFAVGDERAAVVATTSHPERVAPELLRPGLLEQEIQIPLPRRKQRRAILEVHSRRMPLDHDVRLDEIAARTSGFVAADLLALCREASLRAAQRFAAGKAQHESPAVRASDFDAALEGVRPSALEGAAVEIAHVRLDEVGDMEDTKKQLEEAVIWPLRYPETFERLGIAPPSGVLLYGPPGCGKTFLVKALAHAGEASFLAVKGAELLSKWVGESERGVRELFRRARGAAPTLIFFDEIDALAPARGRASDSGITDRIVAQLLTELDGIEELQDVFVIGATKRPDIVDPALLRPGRLERLVYVPPPDASARAAILSAAARKMPLAGGVDLAGIATSCDGYSAADLDALARGAAMIAIRDDMKAPEVTAAHFERARAEIRPSLRAEDVAALERFAADLQGS